jgi:hypothetical protein
MKPRGKGALMNNTSLQSPMVKLSKECISKSYTQKGRSTNNTLDSKKKRSRKLSSCIFLAVCVCQCCEKFDVNIAKRPRDTLACIHLNLMLLLLLTRHQKLFNVVVTGTSTL